MRRQISGGRDKRGESGRREARKSSANDAVVKGDAKEEKEKKKKMAATGSGNMFTLGDEHGRRRQKVEQEK
jgi:hypothetical protein